MERKRKLPPRAAARIEQASKKRTTLSPAEDKTETPTTKSATPVIEEPPQPLPPVQQLPKSIQPGKPLPSVDEPQPEDLSNKEYQSIQESGVIGESLHRSRQKWISEGIFERYWAKPSKRKGVVIEEPNNPPKDSMIKLGVVTIIVEPHIFEATMYGVKDPKPPAPITAATPRPVLQYGPPNGTMPPPPPPGAASSPSTPKLAQPQSPRPNLDSQLQPSSHQPDGPTSSSAPSTQPQDSRQESEPLAGAPPASNRPQPSAPSPTVAAASAGPSTSSHPASAAPPPPSGRPPPSPIAATGAPTTQIPVAAQTSFPSRPPPPSLATPVAPVPQGGLPMPPAPPPGVRPADPIIVMLAGRATADPELRDLMKRVATGTATKEELVSFQALIEKITADTKRNAGPLGPSADKLFVAGKSVRYFADEVRTILGIVLTTNPNQTSAALRPPEGSDPLVVLLVKAALDDPKIHEMITRIADNRPILHDTMDVKQVLDDLAPRAAKELEMQKKTAGLGPPASPAVKANGATNGAAHSPQPQQPVPQVALRSKGPPPAPKPDINAVVFEFHGGTGDRYLFPKFSILEFIPSPGGGSQLLASFVVVRKGSTTEYGGDPELDYWQPVTIRLQSPSQRLLENVTKVVASPDEVRRYMNDVMDNMTRAEYVLLAMRLPRATVTEKDESGVPGKETTNGNNGGSGELEIVQEQPHPGILWTARAGAGPATVSFRAANRPSAVKNDDEQYQKFVASVMPKPVDDA